MPRGSGSCCFLSACASGSLPSDPLSVGRAPARGRTLPETFLLSLLTPALRPLRPLTGPSGPRTDDGLCWAGSGSWALDPLRRPERGRGSSLPGPSPERRAWGLLGKQPVSSRLARAARTLSTRYDVTCARTPPEPGTAVFPGPVRLVQRTQPGAPEAGDAAPAGGGGGVGVRHAGWAAPRLAPRVLRVHASCRPAGCKALPGASPRPWAREERAVALCGENTAERGL